MEIKVVSASDMTKDNPTLCMSPLRFFDACHRCEHFSWRMQYLKKKYADENMSIDELINRVLEDMPCKPRLKKEFIELLKKKTELLQELGEIQRQIDKL